jgi:peptidyl-prolyl cis-trans isomerase B (cyclophilin B)
MLMFMSFNKFFNSRAAAFLSAVSLVLASIGVATANSGDKVMVEMHTSKGLITLELDAEKAPVTVANFIEYVNSGHFDGTIFHRVIPGFVIQGGGLESGMKEKPTQAPIENEADNGLKNVTGSICMARTNDPHSATSQFFINLKDNQFLDHTEKSPQGWGYAVFGQVTGGMDVVEAIAAVQTGNAGFHQDVPVEDIVVEKVTITDQER